MNKALREFLNYLKLERNYSGYTLCSYENDLENFHKYLAKNNKYFDKITIKEIRNYLQGEMERGICKSTIRRRLSCLRTYYNFLVRYNFVLNNPFLLVTSPKPGVRYPHIVSPESIDELILADQQRIDFLMPRDQAIIHLLISTGMRASELLALNMQDIDLKNRVVHVFGKGKKERIIPFTEKCRDSVKIYLEDLRPMLLAKKIGGEPSNALILSSKGDRLSVRGLEYVLKSIEKKTCINLRLHPHKMRHTFATYLLEKGADLRFIQELMGHESLNTTQIYTHVTQQQIRQQYMMFHPRAKKKLEDDKNEKK